MNIFRYGCCSDGETLAGPTDESCDENQNCKNGPFGCCPDESTFSQGPQKQGCFECPVEVHIHFAIYDTNNSFY